MKHLTAKYGVPRAVLARQLSPPGALEYEIGMLVAELATRTAHTLFAEEQPPPAGADMFDRAVAGVYQRLQAAREAAEEQARQQRYAESDAAAARMRAEQQQQTGEQP